MTQESDKVTAADYVLAVSEAELATTRTALLDQLALPAAHEVNEASGLPYRAATSSEPSQFTPTGRARRLGRRGDRPYGDTDTTRR